MMKRIMLVLYPCLIFAQVSATQYFESISAKYQNIEDMQAKISLNVKGLKQTGTLLYKFPDKFIVNLDSNNQVFASDGEVLTVYVPALGTSFRQELTMGKGGGGGKSGLMSILSTEYSVSYTNSPNLEPLDESSGAEHFIKLTFSRRLHKGAATIDFFMIAFTPNGIMRRVVAYPTGGGKEIIIDLLSVKFNIGLPESKFKYELPKTSNKVDNFLYDVKKT
ncbi:outer membrane lipoprotein carrier protein LolA [Borrelia miyamotoi]|uniref:Outer membrane lipoprotein carrier protein LolA n=2 Tax=Borrelia miyamotoi TaxID=47466 RepID=A0AAQ2WVV8_9SPIR|nr:outer membrane lipoprotein carrier protein LolA [Borrelia miyamotoi]AJA58517.1 export chaperone [Borrelia miyamotoi]AOW95594.1 export chaperone [Borrelia miyamotoi]QTL83480.1 outer membrane lipoprotein carrier protein LolA [Borrelia miyamotoi]WAZ85225.1 outer membrane lipoprotein carrier protein LolA [Borrelia miyamotoi]WAZ91009.1 outer membrane lipoprotein carrier protein LolA [Borrelia miyamotoi]